MTLYALTIFTNFNGAGLQWVAFYLN